MSAYVVPELTCDGCGRYFFAAGNETTVEALRSTASNEGWVEEGDRDLCISCHDHPVNPGVTPELVSAGVWDATDGPF